MNEDLVNEWIYCNIKNYNNRYEVYYGGSGSGKSYGAMLKIILKACVEERKILVIRKVKATILHSIYELTKNIVSSVIPSFGFTFTENKTDFVIYISNGSKFIFKGMDDSEKIKSITDITDIVIEEATELCFSDFMQLDIRLRPKEKNPQIYIMFNPISKANWCYKHWFEKTPNNALVVKTNYKDNKFLSSEYKETLENLINSDQNFYKVYCLGQFVTLDKLIFPNYTIKDLSCLDTGEMEHFVGLDFGYINDPSAIIYGFYGNESIYITGEYVEKGMHNVKIADIIKKLGLVKELIIADCAENKSIDEIKNLGIRIKPCKKGSGSILNDIEFILRHNIFIDQKCTNVIEEFENYTWQKDKISKEYINTPIDKFNHTIDALRYGLQSVKNKKPSLKIMK